MSTKGTIWMRRDGNIHVYDECFDDEGFIYIETRVCTEDGAVYSETTVELPVDAARAIARHVALRDKAAKGSK